MSIAHILNTRLNQIKHPHFTLKLTLLTVPLLTAIFHAINEHNFSSSAVLNFVRCYFPGKEDANSYFSVSSNTLSLQACQFTHSGFILQGEGEKTLFFSQVKLKNSTLNFTAFKSTGQASLIFVDNLLKQSTIIARPIAGDNVIWEKNLEFSI